MSNQEIFNILAENECNLFYAMLKNPENAELKAAHDAADKALVEFAKATGCHN